MTVAGMVTIPQSERDQAKIVNTVRQLVANRGSLNQGGTGTDLSAAGPGVLVQASSGALVTNDAQLPLSMGGTNADLSATGGTSRVLKQTAVGAAVTVAQLAASDLSNGTTGSGAVALAVSPSFTTPAIGAATGTSLDVTSHVLSSGKTSSDGIGYSTGAGGTVTQLTNKSTGVTLNAICGQITTNNANLVGGTATNFVLTNSAIAANDLLVLNHASGGTFGFYGFQAQCASGSATISIRAFTTEAAAVVISFAVIKAVTS